MSEAQFAMKNTRAAAQRLAVAALGAVLMLGGCSGGRSAGSETPIASTTAPVATASATSPAPAASATAEATAEATATSTPEASAPGEDTLEARVAQMSLEEKIGQMLLVGIEGTSLDAKAKTMIASHAIGGIILYKDNIADLAGMVALTNDLKLSNWGNGVPLFISVDQEGGKVSRLPAEYASFPSNREVGNSGKTEDASQMGQLLAKAVRSAGFNMDFAPVLDINSNPKNPVIGDRSFGSSADLVTKLGLAEMNGIAEEGIVPVIKHFPGHGDTGVDSHLELPVVNKTPAQLAKLEWLPFQAAINAQADVVMVAHILYPKLDPDKPASLSKAVIGDLLRDKMGFDGVVITDDLTMGAIVKNYTLAAAAVDSVQAGSDILLVAHGYDNEASVRAALLKSVKSGAISEARIDESVRRILALKDKYKLNDHSVEVPNLSPLNKEIKAWKQSLQR
ncbi:beta-N-acetylhexosaminidase [Paenibacillus sp. NFR01]|uniref:beta-N-acetylhexosaminidase n=1 Tax=Paenibacillus sp. NFR01 TaxID=1566279 RepID=UPI0008D27A9A|nr:beta-N-acetylhexosaminidase [Paenibacillus sp. NFR01]SET18300.1 beta-N-acetylhexosaminidase [Paenibacillus sp. NFR01]